MSAINNTQRVIKGFAIALAVFLMMVIGSVLIAGVSFLGYLAWGDDVNWSGQVGDWQVTELSAGEIRDAEINVRGAALKIRKSDKSDQIRVETNNENVRVMIDGQVLHVIEKGHGIFGWGGVGEVIIYIPERISFREFRLEAGAGALDIDYLDTNVLDLELGAGKTAIAHLKVKESARIDGGAGLVEIKDGSVRNLDLEVGAGKADLRFSLTGNNKIGSGVGRLDLELLGHQDDYRLEIDKGLGAITVNGDNLEDGAVWGNGESIVRIDAGVGAVEISTTTDEKL